METLITQYPGISAVVALMAGVLVGSLWLAHALRPWLEQSLSEALGRTVRIVGVVRPLVSLYPGLMLGDASGDEGEVTAGSDTRGDSRRRPSSNRFSL